MRSGICRSVLLAAGVVLVFPTGAQTQISQDLVGTWKLTPVVDKAALYKDVTIPENKKLLDAAVARALSATVQLSLDDKRVCIYRFVDGRLADAVSMSGTWTSGSDGVHLSFDTSSQVTLERSVKMTITRGSTISADRIPGLPAFFSGQLQRAVFDVRPVRAHRILGSMGPTATQ